MSNKIGVNACVVGHSLSVSQIMSNKIGVNACVVGHSLSLSQHIDVGHSLSLSQHIDVEQDRGERVCSRAFSKSLAAHRCRTRSG